VPCRKCDDQIAMNDRNSAPRHDYAAIRPAREGCKVALKFAGIANVNWAHLQPELWCYRLDGAELADPLGYGGIT
jgi:hypothetical protein